MVGHPRMWSARKMACAEVEEALIWSSWSCVIGVIGVGVLLVDVLFDGFVGGEGVTHSLLPFAVFGR